MADSIAVGTGGVCIGTGTCIITGAAGCNGGREERVCVCVSIVLYHHRYQGFIQDFLLEGGNFSRDSKLTHLKQTVCKTWPSS